MNKPEVLVVGATGYLGKHFYKTCSHLFPDTLGTSRQTDHNLLFFDLANPSIESVLDNHQFTHGIITAGITKIALCEQEPKRSWDINVTNTLSLVEQLIKKNIKPVLFSTDCVFDGSQEMYQDQSPTSPLNNYGSQKAFLEKEIPKICGDNFLMLRLSKTYSIEEDSTLLHEITKKLINKEIVRAATDLCFCPIYVGDVIQTTLNLITHNISGLFNLAGPDYISYAKLSYMIADGLGISRANIQEISIQSLSPSTKRANYLHLKNPSLYKSLFKQSFFTIKDATEKISNTYPLRHTL